MKIRNCVAEFITKQIKLSLSGSGFSQVEMEQTQSHSSDGLEPIFYSEEMKYLLEGDNDIKNIINDPTLFQNNVQPVELNMIPSNEDYPGPYNFEIFLDREVTKNWVYSSGLRKIFITPHNSFPVDFKWTSTPDYKFLVRAMPLFSTPEDAHEIVQRCHNHAHYNEASNRDIPPHIWDHIIRCKHNNAIYEGGSDTRYSVIVPLGQPQTGVDTVRHIYEFVCQNSCPSGMNRRPIEVVFTLEDQDGMVQGRTRVNVRICSCPKRDKEKEEKEELKKNGGLIIKPPQAKKRKLPNTEKKPHSFGTAPVDTTLYEVKFKIPGKQNFKFCLEHALGLLGGEIYSHGVEEPYKSCYNELSCAIKNLEKSG